MQPNVMLFSEISAAEARTAQASSRPSPQHQANAATAPKQPEAKPWEYRPGDMSDAGNAAAFAAWVQERLRYCPELGWLHWSGSVWAAGDYYAVDEALCFTSDMLADALDNYARVCRAEDIGSTSHKAADAYRAFAVRSRQDARIHALLDLCQGALRVDIDDLDSDGYGLNCPGGYVDLRSGKLLPHNPARLCTHITACDPGKDGSEAWEKFLDEITQGDGSLRGYLQQVAGMATVGTVLTEAAVFLIGAGRNGKSTFLNALAGVLGSYAATMPVDVLTTARQQRGAVFAELRGRRLVQTGELEQGSRLSVATLKQLCSTDRIPCERKYCAPGSFRPTHTVVMASNYLPRVGSDDVGTWRRIVSVPFQADFSGKSEVKNLAAKLIADAGPAILAWCVEGAKLYLREGGKLTPPDIVVETTEDYRTSEDKVGNFLQQCCEIGDPGSLRTQARTLYQAYRDFAENAGEYAGREREFSASLAARGYRQVNTHGLKWWLGIKIVKCVSSGTYREYA